MVNNLHNDKVDMHCHKDMLYAIKDLLHLSWEVAFYHINHNINDFADKLASLGARKESLSFFLNVTKK
uniref:Uncharacterized protein n=1 Tax=Cajanus cajan TaxID=3821 RepID=A0A151R4G8_CAJCA|nr:hypothetical protein KK1_041412 [Cajanus cajan]